MDLTGLDSVMTRSKEKQKGTSTKSLRYMNDRIVKLYNQF